MKLNKKQLKDVKFWNEFIMNSFNIYASPLALMPVCSIIYGVSLICAFLPEGVITTEVSIVGAWLVIGCTLISVIGYFSLHLTIAEVIYLFRPFRIKYLQMKSEVSRR